MDDSLVTIMQDTEEAIFWARVAYCIGCVLFMLCTISLVVIASQLERGASALQELVAQGIIETVQEMPSDSPPPPMLHTRDKSVFHGEPVTPPPPPSPSLSLKNRDDEDLKAAKWLGG